MSPWYSAAAANKGPPAIVRCGCADASSPSRKRTENGRFCASISSSSAYITYLSLQSSSIITHFFVGVRDVLLSGRNSIAPSTFDIQNAGQQLPSSYSARSQSTCTGTSSCVRTFDWTSLKLVDQRRIVRRIWHTTSPPPFVH